MLLSGQADPEIAARLGAYLATIHAATAGRPEYRDRWGDLEVFDQLRIDPFYRRIAEVHPTIQPAVARMIDAMSATQVCVVHADYSPKNILLTQDRLTLVDYETGHYGDPAFDLGFFLSHLLLKTVLHAPRAEEYLTLPRRFWREYSAGVQPLAAREPFAVENLGRRTIPHLAGCMLARIDGKSTIDYLPDPRQQDFVRRFTIDLFLRPPKKLTDVFDALQKQLETTISTSH